MPQRDARRVDMQRRDTHDVPRKDVAPTVIKAMVMSVGVGVVVVVVVGGFMLEDEWGGWASRSRAESLTGVNES